MHYFSSLCLLFEQGVILSTKSVFCFPQNPVENEETLLRSIAFSSSQTRQSYFRHTGAEFFSNVSPNWSGYGTRRYCRCNKTKIKFYHNWNPLSKLVCSQVRLNNPSKRSNSRFDREGTGPEFMLCCQRRRYQIQVVGRSRWIEIVILPSSCSQIWPCCKQRTFVEWKDYYIDFFFYYF